MFCRHNVIYYVNANEIPGELSRENMISSHVKIACYLQYNTIQSGPEVNFLVHLQNFASNIFFH